MFVVTSTGRYTDITRTYTFDDTRKGRARMKFFLEACRKNISTRTYTVESVA